MNLLSNTLVLTVSLICGAATFGATLNHQPLLYAIIAALMSVLFIIIAASLIAKLWSTIRPSRHTSIAKNTRPPKSGGLRIISSILWHALMLPILYVSFVFGMFSSIMVMHEVGHSKILRSDHAQLLAGCREMIANFEQYSYSIRTAQWNRDHQVKPIDLWDWSNEQPIEVSPRIPESVENINPRAAWVSTNYIVIQPQDPPRSRIIAFSEGTKSFPIYGNNGTNLIEGLYYFRY